MTVYVDELREVGYAPNFPYKYACHMTADSEVELVQFALSIGLRADWIHRSRTMPHFDITSTKRALAKRKGAVDMPGKGDIRAKVAFFAEIRRKWGIQRGTD